MVEHTTENRGVAGSIPALAIRRVLVTGGSGVLGRAVVPLLRGKDFEVDAPDRSQLDLFDPGSLDAVLAGATAVMHLATRIPPPERQGDPGAWRENDRLRATATKLIADRALAAGVAVLVLPTVALVYPDGPADEGTPIADVPPSLRSAIGAEREVARFAAQGGRGVVLRLGLLDGPGTGLDEPLQGDGPSLHVEDAATALLAALSVPSGIYNVVRDRGRVANARFREAAGWRPRH